MFVRQSKVGKNICYNPIFGAVLVVLQFPIR